MQISDVRSVTEAPMIKIQTGKFDIIANGSVISFNNDPIELSFPTRDDLAFTLKFESTNNANEIAWKKEITDNKRLVIVLLNFDSQLGVGFSKPEQVAIMGGRLLHMALMVRKTGTVRSIEYSFYLGDKVM